IPSPSSATSRKMPIRMRGCGSGSASRWRRRDACALSTPSLREALATKQSRLPPQRDSGLLRCARNDGANDHQRRSGALAYELTGGYPMNIRSNPDKTVPAVTTGPLPSSRKIFASPDAAPDLRVPLREIILSEGAGEPNLPVYDTSGPYTDPPATMDVNAGLKRARIDWVKERGGVEEYQGREIKPEDNGNVGASHAAKAFTAHHKPLRGLDGHMITQLEFARAGINT